MARKPKASASANVVAARERAQQLAMAPMARQQRLLDRAIDFFLAQERQDRVREDGEREIRAIRERVVKQVKAARVEAGAAVVSMLGEDESVGAVAERLGVRRVEVQELRRLARVQEGELVGEPGARAGVARSASGPGAGGSGGGGAGGGTAVVAPGGGGGARVVASGGAGGVGPVGVAVSGDGGAEGARGPGAGAG